MKKARIVGFFTNFSLILCMENQHLIPYDPFIEGYYHPCQRDKVSNFDDVYTIYKPLIMKNLGPEITQFCKKYPKAESAKIVRRFIFAMVIRIAFTKEKACNIEIIKSTVPANVIEFCFLMDERIPRDYRYEDQKKMQTILKDRFDGVKELMKNGYL